MKRSDFVTELSGLGRHNAEVAAQLADRAGTPWDPEEPKLPERVRVTSNGYLVPEGSCGTTHEYRVLTHREAAACYNTIHGLLRQYKERSEPEWVMWLEDFIDAERERLK